MHYDILMTQQANMQFTAQVLMWPDIVISGKSESVVLEKVRKAILEKQHNSRIIRLEVPNSQDDPWLRHAGMWKDDPDWEEYEAELQLLRQSDFGM